MFFDRANHPRLIAADPSVRTPAPQAVYDYQAYPTWHDEMWGILGDILDERVRSGFKRKLPEYVVSDDLTWLNELVERATGRLLDTKSLAADRILRRYTFLRACHATRTEDVGGYYTYGLRPLDAREAHARAESIFLAGSFPEPSQEDLNQAIIQVGTDLRAGRVFFDANEWSLINDAGCYLLYEGEYLIALAVHLGRQRDYRQERR